MKKHQRTRKLLRKVKAKKMALKLNKAKLKHYAKEIKQVALTPAVLGTTAAVAGAALLWFLPRKLRQHGVAVVAPQKHSGGLMKFVGRGIALASSLSALASVVNSKRRH